MSVPLTHRTMMQAVADEQVIHLQAALLLAVAKFAEASKDRLHELSELELDIVAIGHVLCERLREIAGAS